MLGRRDGTRIPAQADNLAVPGSNPRFLVKARELAVDEVFLDLEDAVAPAEKEQSRAAVTQALRDGGWGSKIRAVRVNDVRHRLGLP